MDLASKKTPARREAPGTMTKAAMKKMLKENLSVQVRHWGGSDWTGDPGFIEVAISFDGTVISKHRESI